MRLNSKLLLVLALGFVLGCRLLLYVWTPERSSDFDLLYGAATRLIGGENPYPPGAQGLPHLLPAVLLAAPFTALPLRLARPIFDILVGWAFVYALWRHRGPYALLALGSGAYLSAMLSGQTTPLMVAAVLIPALGFLLAVKPNSAIPLWIARPSWTALLGVSGFVALSFLVRPSWPQEWWMALPVDVKELMPPIMRPLGFLLLLAAIRWRSAEGRLLLAIAFVPQTALPYELVPLALIPASLREMGIFVGASWIPVAVVAGWLGLSHSISGWTPTSWAASLAAVYLPMLYLVLRRSSGSAALRIEKERRRPNRVPDEELEVDVSLNGNGEVVVTVIHLPTRLSSTETGETRQVAERKAHDKLAAILAGKARRGSPK
jgi:hypothetical protein